jgi:hypothetical protein
MALATIEITPESWEAIKRLDNAAERWMAAVASALGIAVGIGGDQVVEWMQMGELGLTPGGAGQGGLSESVQGWMISETEPLGAIGVPGNYPAAVYAGIQEWGGTIVPKPDHRFLAIPISDEARKHDSPREMDGLVLIKRKTKSWLLARPLGNGGIEPHWVLRESVELQATHWLSHGVERAAPEMARVMLMELQQFLERAA